MQQCSNAAMQQCSNAAMQQCSYAAMQLCSNAAMQLCAMAYPVLKMPADPRLFEAKPMKQLSQTSPQPELQSRDASPCGLPSHTPPRAARRNTAGHAIPRAAAKTGNGKAEQDSLVNQTVNSLRRRILSLSQENMFLGSEEQLIEALGVSRPTFRQAVRLLEHERLLKIRRGAGGGFFTMLPSPEAVSRMAAIFLNSRGTTLGQIGDAVMPLMIEAACLVAKNENPEIRGRLAAYLQEHAGFEHGDERERMRVVLGFESLLGALSGNPAIALMMDVMRDLARDQRHGHYQITAERVDEYASFFSRVAQAIEQGDAEMARLLTIRHTRQVNAWLSQQT
jgi:DNA-binding FadR family transcriptional regulator